MLRIEELLKALSEAQVRFVIIGGMAAVAQGSSRVTADLDLCYDRSSANLERVARALTPFHPRLRGVPEDLPFTLDTQTLRSGMNFTLSTSAGDVDLLGEVTGLGAFEEVVAYAEELELFGHDLRVLGLEGLIRAKQATGRPKDLDLLPELRSLLALRQQSQAGDA